MLGEGLLVGYHSTISHECRLITAHDSDNNVRVISKFIDALDPFLAPVMSAERVEQGAKHAALKDGIDSVLNFTFYGQNKGFASLLF